MGLGIEGIGRIQAAGSTGARHQHGEGADGEGGPVNQQKMVHRPQWNLDNPLVEVGGSVGQLPSAAGVTGDTNARSVGLVVGPSSHP